MLDSQLLELSTVEWCQVVAHLTFADSRRSDVDIAELEKANTIKKPYMVSLLIFEAKLGMKFKWNGSSWLQHYSFIPLLIIKHFL